MKTVSFADQDHEPELLRLYAKHIYEQVELGAQQAREVIGLRIELAEARAIQNELGVYIP